MDINKESPTRIEAVLAGYKEGVKAGRAAVRKEIEKKVVQKAEFFSSAISGTTASSLYAKGALAACNDLLTFLKD